MKPKHRLWTAFLSLLVLVLVSSARGDDTSAIPSLEPTVATFYFYWYRWPDHHFDQPGATQRHGHYHTLPDREAVNFLDADWHESQLSAMAKVGIDIALPVYWGAPGAYEHEICRFAAAGLGPMVAAALALGDRSPRIGLFYDTSSLRNDLRNVLPHDGRPDLTTLEGRELFSQTVIEYFERVPRTLWGLVDGRALVVLYASGFAENWDEKLGKHLRVAFEKRFAGEGIFLVSDTSWGEIGQDRTTSWGAALRGPQLFPGVAQIGPGFNDSPVPGRRTPIREREEGNFYRYSWRAALAHDPELVLLETWNEMHEGTEICETLETETQYLDLTTEWIQKLKLGQEPGPEISLRWPGPRARPDLTWGREAAGKFSVSVDYASKTPYAGLREQPWADGPLEQIDGAMRSPAPESGDHRFLYFQVSDHWTLATPREPAQNLLLEINTAAPAPIEVQYDSHDQSATLAGAYTSAARITPSAGGPPAKTQIFRLSSVYLANRQNGASDFRLLLRGQSAVDIVSVTLRVEGVEE